MRNIFVKTIAVLLVMTACVPNLKDEFNYSDETQISKVLVGNAEGMIATERKTFPDKNLDSIFLKDRSADFKKLFMRVNTPRGCKIEPIENAPAMGTYGDFSNPRTYQITSASGKKVNWTVALGYYIPPIGCLADRWEGAVKCTDGIWGSYSPSSCLGTKLGDCNNLKIKFNFWDDGGAPIEMMLSLGPINYETFKGDITLLNDVTVTSWGSTMTFHKGAAGTYNALANTLNLEIDFLGYDLPGGAKKYKFTISQL